MHGGTETGDRNDTEKDGICHQNPLTGVRFSDSIEGGWHDVSSAFQISD